MTETPDVKTFDLRGFLSGRDHPTLEVRASFDEDSARKLRDLKKAADSATDDTVDDLDNQVRELSKKIVDESLVFKLQNIPEGVRRDLLAKVREEFPPEVNAFGVEKVNPLAGEMYDKLSWSAYLRTVTYPGMDPVTVTPEDVEVLYKESPASVHEAINEGISELLTGARAGFEIAAQEADFLSSASTEG